MDPFSIFQYFTFYKLTEHTKQQAWEEKKKKESDGRFVCTSL